MAASHVDAADADRFGHRSHRFRVECLEDGEEERLLVVEVVVHRAVCDARCLRDLVE